MLPSSFAELDNLAQYLKENTETIISISGHTDNTGTEEHNLQLSEARAKAVADYLAAKNLDKARISFKGFGSSVPITSNETEEGRKQNRRVDFILNKK